MIKCVIRFKILNYLLQLCINVMQMCFLLSRDTVLTGYLSYIPSRKQRGKHHAASIMNYSLNQ